MKAYPMSKPQPTTIFETASCGSLHRVGDAARREPSTRKRASFCPRRAQSPNSPRTCLLPIVLAGLVRLIDAAWWSASVLRLTSRMSCRATASPVLLRRHRHCSLGDAGLQVAEGIMFTVQAFREHEKQYMRLASAWSVVFSSLSAFPNFAKAGKQSSRAWLGAVYVLGLFALIAFGARCSFWFRRSTKEGDRSIAARVVVRLRQQYGRRHPLTGRAARLRRARDRRLRRPQRRRAPPDAVACRNSAPSTIWWKFPRPRDPCRSGDLRAADLGQNRILQMLKTLRVLPVDTGCRHATSCASGRAPIPTSATSRCRHVRQADSPIGTS